jgi:carbon-monoxide dehydrogenase medium subunit
MLATAFDYAAPETLDEALGALADDAEARVLAGGQSLVPLLKMRLARPGKLVDLRRLDDLRYVRRDGDAVEIGAMTRHADVAGADALSGAGRALRDAAAAVGDAQVRNRGTLGGSLAHADPSADLTAAALALDAEIRVRSASGERSVGADDFFLGLWTTALEPGEVLTAVRFRVPEGSRGAYVAQRHPASGFALVGVAAVLEMDGDACRSARLGVTGAGRAPFRLRGVEAALSGSSLDGEAVRSACEGAGEAVENPQSDVQASADYRRALTEVMARRAVLRAATA